MCLAWEKKVWQRNELTRKGTLSPSMRLLPLRTRTELLGYSVGGFTNEIESYSQLKNDTFRRENAHFNETEKNDFNWNLC